LKKNPNNQSVPFPSCLFFVKGQSEPLEVTLMPAILILVGIVLGTGLFFRYGRLLFLQDPKKIGNLKRLGFYVSKAENKEKIEGIVNAILTGYNTMITHKTLPELNETAEQFSLFYRSFYYEGTAMGYFPKTLFSLRYKRKDFELVNQSVEKNYLYLHYIGLGFWFGMRYKNRPDKIAKLIRHLNPLLRELCYDGYAFKLAFLDFLKNRRVIENCEKVEGYARHVCYQGFGRGLWFVYMDDPERIFAEIEQLEEISRGDAYSGLGLAVLFTNINNLPFVFDFIKKVPAEYRADFNLGVVIALATRFMNNPIFFKEQQQELPDWQQQAIHRSVQLFDEHFQISTSYQAFRNRLQELIVDEALFEESTDNNRIRKE
jgi:enediyne biosynthesis protein E3